MKHQILLSYTWFYKHIFLFFPPVLSISDTTQALQAKHWFPSPVPLVEGRLTYRLTGWHTGWASSVNNTSQNSPDPVNSVNQETNSTNTKHFLLNFPYLLHSHNCGPPSADRCYHFVSLYIAWWTAPSSWQHNNPSSFIMCWTIHTSA